MNQVSFHQHCIRKLSCLFQCSKVKHSYNRQDKVQKNRLGSIPLRIAECAEMVNDIPVVVSTHFSVWMLMKSFAKTTKVRVDRLALYQSIKRVPWL